MIRIVFDSKLSENLIKKQLNDLNDTLINQEESEVPFEHDFIRVSQTHTDKNVHLPTMLLQSREWTGKALTCFNLHNKLIVEDESIMVSDRSITK